MPSTANGRFLRLAEKVAQVAEDVLLHLGEELRDARIDAVLFPEVVELMAHGEMRHAAVQFVDLLVGLLVELARLGQEVADLGVHFLLMLFELVFLFRRELFQLLRG